MPKRVADGGEGSENGNGVYCFIRDLIVEGKDAKLVNGEGRFVINWSRALDRYADYKSKKNPQFKCKKYNRRTASNGLRSALLNFYKKEGAKEYKESKQVNEKDEVVERQFQMPPRVFASLFGEVQLTEKSEQDMQETSSTASEGEMDAQVSPNSSSSDTGFDEFMDMPLSGADFEAPVTGSCNVPGDIPTGPSLNVVKTEEDGEGGDVFLTDTSFPSQMFDDASALDSALEEICSDGPSDEISEDMDLLGVVQDICPTSGSVKGGYQFYISLTEQLPDDVTSGTANFEGVASAKVHKLNPFTLSGTVPASHQPGDVPVTVVTQTGQRLGMTCFQYVDEMREMVKQLVKDPALQASWFAIWSQEHGFFGNDSNIAQVLGPLNVQDQDSSSQTKQQQSLKVLQLLVYTAAQTDAQQFIEMIFSTSAGQVVFNSYKDRTPLPEDVARANGHEDLAQYLQDVNIRLSKLTTNDVQANAIDWLELVKAVQNQASVAQDESSKPLKQSRDNDDNSSEYFADAETSSCGSFDLDDEYDSDSDNKESLDKEPCTSDGICGPEPSDRPIICEEDSYSKIPAEKIEPADSKEDERVSKWGFTYSLSEWLNKWRKKEDNSSMPQAAPLNKKVKTELSTTKSFLLESLFGKGDASCEATVHQASKTRTTKPKEHGQHNHARSPRKTDPGLKYRGVLLACVLVTVLVGLKLGEGQILHWAVGSGYTRISKLLLHCGLYVDAPGFLKETPLHLASKNGFKDLVDILVQSGGNVNAQNVQGNETPLHLASQNGHRQVMDIILQHESHVRARSTPLQNTPRHHAAQNGHKQVADILVKNGSDVNAQNFPRQVSSHHLAAAFATICHQHIAKFLIQHGGKVNSRNVPRQETPLHLEAQKGHEHIPEVLIQHGSHDIARNVPWQKPCLHLAAQKEHGEVADASFGHGSDVSTRGSLRQNTSLYLASKDGHAQVAEVLIQHGKNISSTHELDAALLHLSVQNGHKHIAEVLTGSKSYLNVEFMSPLHLGAQCRHQEMSESSLKHGSGVNTRSILLHAMFPLLKPKQLVQSDSKKSVTNNTHCQLMEYGDQHDVEVLAAKHNHNDVFNTNAVPFQGTIVRVVTKNGNKQPVEVLIHHGIDANAKNIFELSSISLISHNGCKKGEIEKSKTNIQLEELEITFGTEDEHHHLLKELGISGNNNFVPTKNRQAQCRHFKANIKHLATQPFKKEFREESSPTFSKRMRDSSATRWVRTRCKNFTQIFKIRNICQKGCCQASSKWCFMPFSTEKRSTRVPTCLNFTELLSLSFIRNIGENWSFYGLICGNTERSVTVELLMDNVPPPHVNSYNHCQPRFTNTIIKLVVVIGALLPLCFVVMLFLWKQSFCRNKTSRENSFNEKVYVVPMRSTFKQCQQCDDLQTQLCEPLNGHLCLDDLPMGRACPEELRMERVRSWLTSNLEEELLCVYIKDSHYVSDAKERSKPYQYFLCDVDDIHAELKYGDGKHAVAYLETAEAFPDAEIATKGILQNDSTRPSPKCALISVLPGFTVDDRIHAFTRLGERINLNNRSRGLHKQSIINELTLPLSAPFSEDDVGDVILLSFGTRTSQDNNQAICAGILLRSSPREIAYYPMLSRPCGICLILNNLCFQDETENRYGGEVDEQSLKELFQGELHFDVRVRHDLRNFEMQQACEEFAALDHSACDAFVCIIISHGGDRDNVIGVRGKKIAIENLTSQFYPARCPTLAEKPKLFVIQACRGSNEDKTIFQSASASVDYASTGFSSDSTVSRILCPQRTDFLLAFSTVPGYVSHRDETSGSLFITVIVCSKPCNGNLEYQEEVRLIGLQL